MKGVCVGEKYSVVMAVYHKENPEHLALAIESILNQTIQPHEFIIVQDGLLTLELDRIINFYENENSFIRVIKLEKNQGPGGARNVGIKNSTSELIAIMDSDDISINNRCEKQLNTFRQFENLAILGGMIDIFYDNPDSIVESRVVPLENDEIKKFMKRRSAFNNVTVMFLKNAFLAVGGYDLQTRAEDYILFSKMINSGYLGKNINETLVLVRGGEFNFKKRKSWQHCKEEIMARYKLLTIKNIGLKDFLITSAAFLAIFIMPMFLLKILNQRVLRKNATQTSEAKI